MTPGTFGPYVLTALPYAGAEALRIALFILITFTPVVAVIIAARHWRRLAVIAAVRRHRARQQRGLDHLAAIAADQQHGRAEAETTAMSMRDLTAMERVTPCPQFCDNLAEVGDPAECGCPHGRPCTRAWCPRLRTASVVPVSWERQGEGGFR